MKYTTSDGWGLVYDVADSSYSSVYFADTLKGWVTAEGILHTVDGGYTWEEEECFPPSQFLTSISVPDPGHGWTGGFPNDIYETCLGTGVSDHNLPKPALYPNPANNLVTVVFSSEQPGSVDVLLFDCSGRLVLRSSELKDLEKNQIQIRLNSLKSGLYYYVLLLDERLSSGKLSIIH